MKVRVCRGDGDIQSRPVPFIEVRITDDEGQLVAIFTSSGYRKNEELPVETLK